MKKELTMGIWMYSDLGGNEIQEIISQQLGNNGIKAFPNLDLKKCRVENGQVLTEQSINLSKLDGLFQMNADDQHPYQNRILQILEKQGVRIINTQKSFNQAIDKLLTNSVLKQSGIPTPRALGINENTLNEEILDKINSWNSILLKPRGMHGGKGIIKWTSIHQLMDGWSLIHEKCHEYYLEEFIPFESHDYRVEVVGGQFAGIYSRKRTHAFKTNISAKGGLMDCPYDHECVRTALKAAEIMQLDCSIVDMIRDVRTGKLYVLEVNPALGVFNEAAIRHGVPIFHPGKRSFENDQLKLDLLINHISQTLKKRKHEQRNN